MMKDFYLCRIASRVGVAFTGWAKVTVSRGQDAFVSRHFGKYNVRLDKPVRLTDPQGSANSVVSALTSLKLVGFVSL